MLKPYNKKRRLTMKKSIGILGLTLVLLLSFALTVQAQSKEVTESATTTFYITSKVLPLGEGRIYMSHEGIGATVSDTGEGLFHNATIRTLGGMIIEKGIYKDERGWGVFNLQDGDKVFIEYTFAGQVNPKGVGTAKGTITIVGGTGKCTGIKGGWEATRYHPRSAIEGIGQCYTKAKGKYTLP
jgi:hypothetical protein